VLVLQEAAGGAVRIEIVSRLPEAERVQRVAVVLGVLEAAVAMEDRNQVLAAQSGDFREAVRAFKERRSG